MEVWVFFVLFGVFLSVSHLARIIKNEFILQIAWKNGILFKKHANAV